MPTGCVTSAGRLARPVTGGIVVPVTGAGTVVVAVPVTGGIVVGVITGRPH
ncbi:hypothetical protein [Verrucosispora sioxanthis]|uniref:hypothetical protein n=1 Tax=Verrucosispora sioxanthis TaxID=2499994 RepID=UPI001C10485D|nr:hypothetical protein [Verrucosispora sioxanthis]